ncbi:MAG: OmpW/AlkL family protein [Inhella sp.]|uniref:OmpW/AlkL family protein n=1 Tax=Inhella sp. TaxID=1921806 RepID=UPI0022C75B09|nr:OmpW family outer membrane protein [Inhella sp.]MCZ8236675.1 outer membrane beta-barrel protein [Inhella sp.]
MSRKQLAAFAYSTLAATTLVLVASVAHAQDNGDWIVRGRALHLNSVNKDSTGLGLSVNDKTFPEVDITYFFDPNWAAELVLTYPQKHDIRSNGVTIGSLKHLPPTLSLQYHLDAGGWRPYAGLGINATLFSSNTFVPAVQSTLNPSIGGSSFGVAYGLGFDVPLGGGWLFNADVKKVQIGTDIKSNGTKVGKFKVDPTLFSIGIGKRF